MKISEYKLYATIKEDKVNSLGFEYNKTHRYWFKDNGANILGVAHLDTVQPIKGAIPTEVFIKHIGCKFWFSPTADDRLGFYIIDHILPSLGVKCDVLLTTDEEIGRSTAQFFTPPKKYNWGFSFDREGDDVVLYNYDDTETFSDIKINKYNIHPQSVVNVVMEMLTSPFKSALYRVGFKIEKGRTSDIEYLNIRAKCFNVGTGLINGHSKLALVHTPTTMSNIYKFIEFYKSNKDTHFPHQESVLTTQLDDLFDEDYYFSRYGYGGTNRIHRVGRKQENKDVISVLSQRIKVYNESEILVLPKWAKPINGVSAYTVFRKLFPSLYESEKRKLIESGYLDINDTHYVKVKDIINKKGGNKM